MDSAVAIIGMGARFPGAPDLTAYRRLLREGRVEHQPVPASRWDHRQVQSDNPRHANRTPARHGAFMDGILDFSPEFFGITPKRARIMDPQQRLVLETSRQALEDAGYARRRLADGRVGVFVGASSSDHRTLVAGAVNLPCDLAGRSGVALELSAPALAAVTAALPPIQAYSIVGQQLNMLAANVSQAFDYTGPAFAIDTACSSALAALHEAVLHLRTGLVDAALVGGVYVQLDPIMMVCFSRVGAISFTDECRPFQTRADGFVLGEGVGVVVVKRLSDALAAGDRVLAVVRGIGMSNDGGGAGPLTPRVEGQVASMVRAWADAGVAPSSVGMLEAHGTATPAGDGIELAAMTTFFSGQVSAPVPVTSVKANIGHGLASAGIASLIKATLAIDEGVVLPQPCVGPLRAEFSRSAAWLRVPTACESWVRRGVEPRRAGVSAFGFGGTNLHVVLEEPPANDRRAASAITRPHTCSFSAPNLVLLEEYLGAVERVVSEASLALPDVAFTLAERRPDTVGAVISAASVPELGEKIAALRLTCASGALPPAVLGRSVEVERGNLVSLPPSPLLQRKFWLMDETKRRPGRSLADVSIAAESPVVGGPGLQIVAAAVAAVAAWREEDVRPELRFVGDLGFDSLTTLEFMTVLGRSLPGVPPPPRTMFTPLLTVEQLVEFVSTNAVGGTAAAVPIAHRFATDTDPWLAEHRPGGKALLPMAALMHAAQGDSVEAAALMNFRVLAPFEVMNGAVTVSGSCNEQSQVILRSANGGVGATAIRGRSTGQFGPVILHSETVGSLVLEEFYREFGFHGQALRALVAAPEVGLTTARGFIHGGPDEVVILDGALQLALFWLAVHRQKRAVAVGFSEYRRVAPWPTTGEVECRASLTAEGDESWLGDFDFYDATGRILAQWRGVEARALGAPISGSAGGVAQWPEVKGLAARKAALVSAGLTMPYFQIHDGRAGAVSCIGGREFVNFSSYDYLGLAGDPAVTRAATAAVERYGTSVSASRVASGERPVHGELERTLAEFLGCEEALALVSGHATNVAVIGHLLGPEDLVVHDSLAHDCIVTGARLSGARRLAFPHNDVAALAELLARERPKARRTLIAVEGVYSMDGDLAPLPEVVALKRRHDALLLVDEAHSLGVLGATGRGAGEHFAVARSDVDLWMGTMSKALASCGGYLAGARAMIDYLRFTLPGFVYSVGLSPANAAAALAALRLLATQPGRVGRLRSRSDFFRGLCRERGVETGASADSAVVPAIIGGSERALRVAQALGTRGINVQPIFFPAVEEGKARLRFFVSAEHSEQQLRMTADALAEELKA